jgi:hypothetical protein
MIILAIVLFHNDMNGTTIDVDHETKSHPIEAAMLYFEASFTMSVSSTLVNSKYIKPTHTTVELNQFID